MPATASGSHLLYAICRTYLCSITIVLYKPILPPFCLQASWLNLRCVEATLLWVGMPVKLLCLHGHSCFNITFCWYARALLSGRKTRHSCLPPFPTHTHPTPPPYIYTAFHHYTTSCCTTLLANYLLSNLLLPSLNMVLFLLDSSRHLYLFATTTARL